MQSMALADAATNLRTLDRHLQAENTHDVSGIVATFSPAAALVLNGQTFRGHDLIRKVHENFGFGGKGGFSNLHVHEESRHIGAQAIILEQVLSGTHTGRWEGLAATGKTFQINVCTVYEFDGDGLLCAERVYFDGGRLLEQLEAE